MDSSYWNAINLTGKAIELSVKQVPVVGGLLSGLMSVLWPYQKADLWGQIKQQVETLINQKLAAEKWKTVSENLQGLQNIANDYLANVDDLNYAPIAWGALNSHFEHDQPSFQSQDYEVLLLPLFAQFGSLYLSTLRDGVLFGKSWGWDSKTVQNKARDLTQFISDSSSYTRQYYQQGLDNVQGTTGTNYHLCQPFRAINQYQREMTLTVLDLMNSWPYMDPQRYPDPVSFYLDREIYSDPVGTCDDSKAINLPSPSKQPLYFITVWKGNFVNAVQTSYPQNGGPGGQTITPRMGSRTGGDTNGSTFPVLGTNPITEASGNYGDMLNGLSFKFKDGTSRGVFGGGKIGNKVDGTPLYGSPYSFSYPGEIVSRIHINGQSNYYGCADCAVFGFKFDPTPTASMAAAQLLYTSTPTAMTLERFAQSMKGDPIDPKELIKHAKEEGWEAQRHAIQERRKKDVEEARGRIKRDHSMY